MEKKIIETNIENIETYPAWNTTELAHIKIKDVKNKRWTDCYVSAIVKNGRIKFFIQHEKGYPSQGKGIATRSILANWLSDNVPEVK